MLNSLSNTTINLRNIETKIVHCMPKINFVTAVEDSLTLTPVLGKLLKVQTEVTPPPLSPPPALPPREQTPPRPPVPVSVRFKCNYLSTASI